MSGSTDGCLATLYHRPDRTASMTARRVGSRPVVSATMLRVSAVGVEVVAI